MMEIPEGRPGDARAFVHKSFIGRAIGKAIKTVVPVVGIGTEVLDVGRSLFRGGGPAQRFVPRTELSRGITQTSEMEKRLAASSKFPGFRRTGPCEDPALVRASDGHCVAPGSGHARKHGVGGNGVGSQPIGEPVLGLYGAGVVPGSMIIDRAVCRKGMQLADDGLCYNKSQISNKQRMWPAGRKPLLSGGDMRAISIAARAGRRLEGATKRLQRLGMMKKPASRPRAPHAHAVAARNVVSV